MKTANPDHLYTTVSVPHGDGRATAFRATCSCGKHGDVLAGNGVFPIAKLKKRFLSLGWTLQGRRHICPSCNGVPMSKPAPAAALPALSIVPDAPRVMSPADKRRVFREIDESWDENKGRYIGSTTDKSIAEKLGVPRAWIELTRTEAFGAARNEDLDLLLGSLKNLQGEARRQSEKCLEMAAGYEEFGKRVGEALRKVGEVA